jgi:hypothetical protein
MGAKSRPLAVATALLAVTLIPTAGVLAIPRPEQGPHARQQAHERSITTKRPSYVDRFTRQRTLSRAAETQADNFRVLGHAPLGGPTPHGDVFFYDHGGDVGKYAYVGTWSFPCSGVGVKIVNVNDSTIPQSTARTVTIKSASHEDVVVQRIADRDVLGIGIQQCDRGGKNGLKLVDVTNPDQPRQIAFFETPGGVHELDIVERSDGQVLALLATPFVEFENTYFGGENGGELRIVDISDPDNPTELSSWGAIADSSLEVFGGNDELTSSFQGLGYYSTHYAHSVRAADDGDTAYVSYWDAGVIKLDISDLADPQIVGRTSYDESDDGDAHSMYPLDVGAKRYILQNDEDFDPLAPTIVTSSATGDARYSGIEIQWAPTLLSQRAGVLTGRVHNAGRGCRASAYKGARGKIALANTVDPFYVRVIDGWSVPCPIGEQIVLAGKAGAKGLLFNFISPDDSFDYGPPRRKALRQAVQKYAKGMPIIKVSDIDEVADQIRQALSAGSVKVALKAGVPSWGYLRIYDEDTAADVNDDGVDEYAQVGRFTDLPHVRGERRTPPGAWSIHNTEVNGERAYSSWYSHGVVALDLSDPEQPTLSGQFVPAPSARFQAIFGPPGASVWGVAIDPVTGITYASDMRSGLWIVRPTGAAAP